MAYIIGYLTKEEIEELEDRGWDLEDPPNIEEWITTSDKVCKMIFVDANVFDIMSGPDWEQSKWD